MNLTEYNIYDPNDADLAIAENPRGDPALDGFLAGRQMGGPRGSSPKKADGFS